MLTKWLAEKNINASPIQFLGYAFFFFLTDYYYYYEFIIRLLLTHPQWAWWVVLIVYPELIDACYFDDDEGL